MTQGTLQIDFENHFWCFTADFENLVNFGWQKYLKTKMSSLMRKVKFLGQNLVLPSSFWYQWKALEKFFLRMCPYFLKFFSKKGV